MKKRIIAVLTAIIFLMALSYFLKSQDKVIYGLSEGTYCAVGYEDAFSPRITFDLNNYTFEFTYDILSSYINKGSIKIEKGQVAATTDDGKYTYIFDIKDNDTITFVEEGSSKIPAGKGETPIVDKTEFKYADER